LANLPSQLIPFVSLQRWIAGMVDPIYRKSERGFALPAISESMMKNIPGLSKGIDPYLEKEIGPEGKERFAPARREYPVLNAFSPVAISKARPEYAPRLKMKQMELGVGKIKRAANEEYRDPKNRLYMAMVEAIKSGQIQKFDTLKTEMGRLGYKYSEGEYNEWFKRMGAK
jgi:hypothetical protein